jgi:ankyrin repeat protein
MTMLDALQQGDVPAFRRLLDEVDDVNRIDEQGWTLLNWAAGRGNVELARLLIAKGADVFTRGRDNRTPYLIALAAGHVEMVRYLAELEEQRGGDTEQISSRQGARRAFCKAYPLGRLRAFTAWTEADRDAPDDRVVFLHHDYSVTGSVTHGQAVVFDAASAEWQAFCADHLGFRIPTDIDLLLAH